MTGLALQKSLAGVTVLDFGQLIAGPVCGMYLADMGATVIKIEPPGGELGRQLGPPWLNGESMTALTSNRGKRGLCIDLKHPDARLVIRRMTRRADVVIENYRPGVMARLGLDHAALALEKPDLITCSLSAFGQDGPWRERAGVDGIIQAASGMMSCLGEPGSDPSKVPLPLADMIGALYATIAVLGALRRRDSIGGGGHLDVSLFNGMLMLQQLGLAGYLNSGVLPERSGSAAPYAAPNEALPTRDGWIMIAAYQPGRWERFCRLIGRPDLATDPRFATNERRVAERAALRDILAPILRERTSAEWCHAMENADILAAEVANYAEVAASAAYAASGLQIEIDHPRAGTYRMPGFAAGGRPATACEPPPDVGEDNRDVLGSFGFSAAEIDALIDRHIVIEGAAE